MSTSSALRALRPVGTHEHTPTDEGVGNDDAVLFVGCPPALRGGMCRAPDSRGADGASPWAQSWPSPAPPAGAATISSHPNRWRPVPNDRLIVWGRGPLSRSPGRQGSSTWGVPPPSSDAQLSGGPVIIRG